MCFAALRCVPERDVQNESSYGVRCSVFLCRSALQCVSARCSVCVCCGALQCVAARCSLCVCCNALQCVAARCSVCVCCSALQCVAERDMQDEALYCTLPCGPGSSCTFLSATHCNTPNTPQHTATHCNTLDGIMVHVSCHKRATLYRKDTRGNEPFYRSFSVLQCVRLWRSVAVCCSLLRCVARRDVQR